MCGMRRSEAAQVCILHRIAPAQYLMPMLIPSSYQLCRKRSCLILCRQLYLRKVWRESKGIIKLKGIAAAEERPLRGALSLVEALQALLQCSPKADLLIPAYETHSIALCVRSEVTVLVKPSACAIYACLSYRQANTAWLCGQLAKLSMRPLPYMSAWKALPDDLSN